VKFFKHEKFTCKVELSVIVATATLRLRRGHGRNDFAVGETELRLRASGERKVQTKFKGFAKLHAALIRACVVQGIKQLTFDKQTNGIWFW